MFSFFITLTLAQLSWASVCVLSFFEKNSREDKQVAYVFKNYEKADFFQNANLNDVKHCFSSSNYSEIVWLAHGLAATKSSINNYSLPLMNSITNNGSYIRMSLPTIYFESLINKINLTSLKKVRVSLCGIDFTKEYINDPTNSEFKSSIDILLKYLHQKGVEIDVSERSNFFSNLIGSDVTRLNTAWLAKSISAADYPDFTHWATSQNSDCRSEHENQFFIKDTEENTNYCDKNNASYVIPLKP